MRLFGANIVDHPDAPARVWPDVVIHFPWKLSLGAGCLVGPGCRIYNLGVVSIAAGANLSRHIHVCSGSHDFSRWDMQMQTSPIDIGKNVWIATDSFIGPGVKIGELSVVGARSVVISDLPAGMLCVGHPCKPLKPRPPIK